ncbi:MAG: class II fructose-bisphosphatase [Clostridia bacterium]|nr:class II fructose-bisphosphatase [Clostridia bacterium]MDD4048140.1 class II fructose-bisphosphatase [Clostridia bacterium]
MERELALEFVRVTEAAAIASARWLGRGDKNNADGAAVGAMRSMFDTVNVDGIVVIGEGEKDEAPMLYVGEKVGTGKCSKVDIAVDPLEGTDLVAKGLNGAIAVLAVAPRKCLLHAPDMYYMNKIAVGQAAVGKISLDASITENVTAVAKSLNKEVQDVTVVVLDRSRNEYIINELRSIGARIRLITAGDVSPAVAVAIPGSGVDMVMGIGGAPEGVLGAAALRCLGGELQGRLWDGGTIKSKRVHKSGVTDTKRILTMDDLVSSDDVIFAATGITDGDTLKGVRYYGNYVTTHSIVMRAASGTVRFLEAQHRIDKKSGYVNGREY